MVSLYPDYWTEQEKVTTTKGSEKEAKIIKKIMCIATEKFISY